MLPSGNCPDNDPNCQSGTAWKGDAGPGQLRDAVSGGLGDGPGGGLRDVPGGGLRDVPGGGQGDVPGGGLRDVPGGGLGDVPGGGLRDVPGGGLRDVPGGGLGDVPGGGLGDGPRDGLRDGALDLAGDARRDGVTVDRGRDGVCGTREICDNGIDDDCNGLADCFDPACVSQTACIAKKKEICTNGIDDDGNGLIDCKDPACFGDPACFVRGHEICNNNLDDDDDGLVDCKDPDCAKDPTCIVRSGDEICNNGIDDNGDGLVDCSDPKCKDFAACLRAACTPEVDFGQIASSGASVQRTISTVGATASYGTCAPPGGVGRVSSFSLASTADLKLDFSQAKGSAHVVALYRAGVAQACDQNMVDCLRVGEVATASQTFNGLAAGNYWIVVQSFTGTTGSTTVTLSTSKPAVAEICNNGKDDDGDGAIDCADLDCASASNCRPCIADINLGAVVVGDAPKTTVADTTTGSDRYHPSCAGTSTGKDIVVRFTIKATVGILLDLTQTGDHAYGLFHVPAAGQTCDDDEGGCSYMGGRRAVTSSWWPLAAGEYLLIFKPIAAGKEGRVTLSLSAFADRGVEICDNGIDDDANNLVDCDDPACTGTINCQALLCLPDSNLGDIDIGTSKSIKADLTTATRTFSTKCGKGDGYGLVYRLNLLRPMGLGVRCTQTGSQVMQLSQQVSPLDLCTDHSVDCVDYTIQPFGCNFVMPSLQPGLYNFVVQAFTSGTEGTMNLTLTGVSETILEICNNGIDDDGDGATDCYDRKCAGDASCEKLVCKPDKALKILPLDGTPTAVAIQTSGAGDDQTKSSCVSGKGGADAVVSFTLTTKADLTIEWAQVGNHALVLYKEDIDSLPCDANTVVDCKATANAATGSYTLTGLTQGKYNLVADADKAGSEGGVIMQISGSPSP
jgi:hypothetical protein